MISEGYIMKAVLGWVWIFSGIAHCSHLRFFGRETLTSRYSGQCFISTDMPNKNYFSFNINDTDPHDKSQILMNYIII